MSMAKRFTDTDKWQDDWYLSLSNDYRIIWQYMLDRCTNAGILKKNFRLLNFCCNTNLDETDFLKTFGSRVFNIGDFFFIPNFLKYQYPKGLNSDKPAIVSVKSDILQNAFSFDLLLIIKQSLGNDYLIVKDKDKDKDTDKNKDKTRGRKWRCFVCSTPENLVEIYESERGSHMDQHLRDKERGFFGPTKNLEAA